MNSQILLLLSALVANAAYAQTAASAPPVLGTELVFTYSRAVTSRPFVGLKGGLEILDLENGGYSEAARSAIAGGNFTALIPNSRPPGAGIAIQLSTIPIATPASGVVFKEDPLTKSMLPSSDSLGTILTERPETMGRGRAFLGLSRQSFRFTHMDGHNMSAMHLLYPGGEPTNVFQNGVRQMTSPATIDGNVDLRLSQNVALLSYGLTNRTDVSIALTTVQASMSVVASNAKIHNNGNPAAGGTCWCAQTFDVASSLSDPESKYGVSGLSIPGVFGSARSSSSGLGDTLLRVKRVLWESRRFTASAGGDLRLPTGDALNLRGSGAVGLKPFVAVALPGFDLGTVRFSPYANFGYQFNGKSVLAGDVLRGVKESLPNQVHWSAGMSAKFHPRMALVADMIGLRVRGIEQLITVTVPGRGNGTGNVTGALPNPARQSFSNTNGSFGLKLRTVGNLVASANMAVAFDKNGTRDRLVPLFGLGYSF
jgi:hypothetical protein